MGITLVTGPANAGKAEVVMGAVRAHLARGEEPLLVVPTGTDAEHYMRELAGQQAAMGVRVERFSGLIAELVRRAGIEQPLLGGLARQRLIATLDAVGAERGPGFLRALGELVAELCSRRVTPQRLAAALAAGLGEGDGALGFDLAGVYGEYTRLLERLGLLDEQQRTLLALDRLRERPSLWGRTPVLFYGFDDLTREQLDAIETLGAVVDAEVMVSLAYEAGRVAFAGRASTYQTLAPLARETRVLAARAEHYAASSRRALGHLERSLFEPARARVDAGAAVELMQGGGERAELELIASRVAGLLDEGVPAHEIAVVVRAPAASAALFGEIFSAAGIPFAMPFKRPFSDTATGRALLGLLRCVPAAGGVAAAGTPADLLAWLRAPGRLQRPELADALELEVRRQGLRTVEQAREHWERRRFPLDAIDRLAEAQRRGPAALADRAGRELASLFAAPRRGRAEVLGAAEMDEARALAGGRAALAELRSLARLQPTTAPAEAASLAGVLAELEVNSGELPGRGRVAVLEPLQLRARRVRALFVSGLQEGSFPQRARPQPLLGERERARIARASGLVLGEQQDTLQAERHLFYALLSRPEERLVLSWHETDDDAGPLARSLFVDDVCDLFDRGLAEGRARRGLGALDAAAAGAAASVSPAGGRLTDDRVLSGLRERPWSGTGIERWSDCPVAWFVEKMLRPELFEPDPEPLVRGGLAHEVLRQTLERLREQTGSARIVPGNLQRALELMRESLAAAEKEERHRVSVSAERALAIGYALRADLERYLEHAAGLQCALEPRELELGFGFDPEDPEDRGEPSEVPAFDLGGGAKLRGRIDRIDIAPGGEAIVIDYKAKTAPAREKWLPERKLQVALYMLAAEQLLGLEVVGGLYQPLSGKDIRARGAVLAGHAAADDCVRTDPLEAEELEELLREALEVARTAVAEAGRGELEARPDSCGWGGRGCRYPTICRCER